jgi:hypothetical protein
MPLKIEAWGSCHVQLEATEILTIQAMWAANE